jgi:CRISPR/Cas system CMR subunit Cmr6 (Cas7 group RAMP superfamily)
MAGMEALGLKFKLAMTTQEQKIIGIGTEIAFETRVE